MATTQPRAIINGTDLRSAYNGTGTAIGAYLAVKVSTSVDDAVLLPAAATDKPLLGLTREIIADQQWGTVQIRGKAIAVAGGSVTKGDLLMVTSAGKLVTFVANAGNTAFAIASRSAANNDEFEVELLGPGQTTTLDA